MSGPQSPEQPELLAEARLLSGPQSPEQPQVRGRALEVSEGSQHSTVHSSHETGATTGAGTSIAVAEEPKTAEKITLRVKLAKELLLAVSVSSPDPMKIVVQKVEIEILHGKSPARTVEIADASGVRINDARNPEIFRLSQSELGELKPVLVPGNFARVTVEYLAENHGELHVAVIGHDQKHSIKEIIEHVFH
jgi:hypothetical protein